MSLRKLISELVRAEKLAPKTIRNHYSDLKRVVGRLSRQWECTLPSLEEDEQRWFTIKEILAIIDAAAGQYKALFRLAGFSGLRAGELFGLHVEDIDMESGIVRVRRSKYLHVETSTKTKKSRRDVHIDPETLRMLREHLAGRKTGRVFQTRNGTPLVGRDVRQYQLHPICRKLGIPSGGLHAFRHGSVSFMCMHGVPDELVKEQVGHTNLRMTGRYTHFTPEYRRNVVTNLSQLVTSGEISHNLESREVVGTSAG